MTQILDLRSLRASAGWRQRDLADALGLKVHELMKIERGLAPLSEEFRRRALEILSANDSNSVLEQYREKECGEGYVTARPLEESTHQRRQTLISARKPVLDVFCGVGGFSAGFEQTKEFEVAAGIDLLGDRLETFIQNHPTANAYGQDVRTISANLIDAENPKPFVIVGGPPCQGFSSIRPFRNVEWNDPRNNLVEEFCRLVSQLYPEWVIFENVVGLLTHENGHAYKAIREAFENIGYRTDARVLNAAYYGLPQRRERLLIVGNRRGKAFRWPQPTHWLEHRSMVGNSALVLRPEGGLFGEHLKTAITIDEAIGDLPELQAGERAEQYLTNDTSTPYQEFIRNKATHLTLHNATAHSEEMLRIIQRAGTSIRALPRGMVSSGFSSCYSRLSGNEPSVTLTVNFVHPSSNRCIHPHQDRALTPREGARLQGFYDTFDFVGTRSQVAKQIGNAVPPILGKKIAESILESD